MPLRYCSRDYRELPPDYGRRIYRVAEWPHNGACSSGSSGGGLPQGVLRDPQGASFLLMRKGFSSGATQNVLQHLTKGPECYDDRVRVNRPQGAGGGCSQEDQWQAKEL